MATLKRILLAEDNERDIEIVLTLEEHRLANEVSWFAMAPKRWTTCINAEITRRAQRPSVVRLAGPEDAQSRWPGGIAPDQRRSELKVIPVVMMTSSREEAGPGSKLPTGSQLLPGQAAQVPAVRRSVNS